MRRWWIFLLFFCGLYSTNAMDSFQREPSEPGSVECPAIIEEQFCDLLNQEGGGNAVIVAIDHGELASLGIEEQLQKTLQIAYGVKFPIVSAADAAISGKCLILPGNARSNLLLRRLSGVGMIATTTGGPEVRVIPDFEEWKQGAIILFGRSAKEVSQAAQKFVAAALNATRIPRLLLLSPEKKVQPPDDKAIAKMTKALRQYFADSPDWLPQQHAFKQLQPLAEGYRITGDDRFARAFAAMQKTYFECYLQLPPKDRVVPSFVFHEFVWMVELISQSSEFTAGDRAFSAEMIRYITEETMNYWEMAGPIRVYEAGKQEYFTNHSIFAARSVWFAAHFLWTHYHYSPARYWMAVAENAFSGIEPHPIGPEDSANYQHICYNIFINFAIHSGLYDLSFFASPAFAEYIRYVIAQYNQNGVTYANGDTHPLGNAGSFPILLTWYEISEDKNCQALLSVIAENGLPWHQKQAISALGDRKRVSEIEVNQAPLAIFYLDDFRLKRLNSPQSSRPRIDKGYFRSGWAPDSSYLAISGVSGAPHGHYDTNAILLYSYGRYWYLVDGDYILKNPEEHNTLSLSFNGEHIRPGTGNRGALAEEINSAQAASGNLAGLETAAISYGPADWYRTILWRARRGFWVSDRLFFNEPGNFQADIRFRTLGEPVGLSENRFGFQQKADPLLPTVPDEFWIHNFNSEPGEFSSQLDDGHGGGAKGYYSNYPFAGELTRVVTARASGEVTPNATVNIVNYCTHEPMKMAKIAENAFLAASENDWSVVLFNEVQTQDIHFDGAWLMISPEGILGAGVKTLKLFGREILPDEGGMVDQSLLPEFSRTWVTAQLQRDIVKKSIPELAVPELDITTIALPASATVIEASPEGWYVGMANGLVRSCDRLGKTLRDWQFSREITALAALPNGGVAVGVAPARPKGPGKLIVIDHAGDIVFEKELKPFHGRPGTIKTILSAKLSKDGSEAIVCGVAGWHFYAFSPTGNELWRREIFHGALCSAAADFDGDGLDSIFVGAEYYDHQILSPNGEVEFQQNTEPWNYSCTVITANSGRPVVLAGRSDDAIHWMTPNREDQKKPVNAGGVPIAIVPKGNHYAALTANGNILLGSADGKVYKRRKLPNSATGMAVLGDLFFIRDRSGTLLQLDADLEITASGTIPMDPAEIYHPGPVASGNSIAAAEKKQLYILSK